MSKNITIQEGGVAKQLTDDKLKTALVGGGNCLWVPEDDVQLGTKSITENGTYKASDDGYYGYSEVTVSGIGTATGTDGDGDDATTTTGEGGALITTKLPSEIRVTTMPTKTVYSESESMDYTGMVVKGYSRSGGDLGEIPHNKLILPSVVPNPSGESSAESDIISGSVPFSSNPTISYDATRFTSRLTYSGEAVCVHVGNNGPGVIHAHADADTRIMLTVFQIDKSTGSTTEQTFDVSSDRSYTYQGKTVYYTETGIVGEMYSSQYLTDCSISEYDPSVGSHGQIAWTIIYGEIAGSDVATVPVKYIVPDTGAELETSFNVTVNSSLGGATGGSGQAGEGGAGRND